MVSSTPAWYSLRETKFKLEENSIEMLSIYEDSNFGDVWS